MRKKKLRTNLGLCVCLKEEGAIERRDGSSHPRIGIGTWQGLFLSLSLLTWGKTKVSFLFHDGRSSSMQVLFCVPFLQVS